MVVRIPRQNETAIITFLLTTLKTKLSIVNVFKRFKYIDEINDFPSVCLYVSSDLKYLEQTAEYGGYLYISLRGYVKSEDTVGTCDTLVQDIEEAINTITDETIFEGIRISTIRTDEGLFSPFGIIDIGLEVLYQ